MNRPYVLLSWAMSVDGYLDDASSERLLLSNAQDFDRVDEVRAGSDAILVGATTVRRDDPRLLVNSAERRAARAADARPPHPVKVTVTGSGLDSSFTFFHTGGEKLVYCSTAAAEKTRAELDGLATVVDGGDPVDLGTVLDDLGDRGIRRLMVEGGARMHTQFLTQNLADELHVAMAPFFVGDTGAPRCVNAGTFPQDSAHRMRLEEVRQTGDVVLARYLTKPVTT
ncbi:dihydrofolate reductase family protein [Actinoplanes sp. NPDC049596]|uniref:RibD family protein n=1 Tax=unclassified Actinoplanes TaxID=2626549 RepID=UPI003429B95A